MQQEPSGESRTELDGHADTCVVGDHAHIVHEHGRTVNVVGREGSARKPKRLKVMDAAVACEGFDGELHILRINQAILVEGQPNNLLCPMQLRLNDVEVGEKPKFLTDDPMTRIMLLQ